jgi:O-antigen/teichoic acid export membrane protein
VLLARRPVLSLFGQDYVAAASLLVPLVISSVPDAITNIAVAAWRVTGQLRLAATLNGAMTLVALGLSWILLPGNGIVAAGWSWVIAQSLGTLAVGGWALAQRVSAPTVPAASPSGLKEG